MAKSVIPDYKTRTQITIERDLKKMLEARAKKENRSFNNLVITILKDYMNYGNVDIK